MTFYGGIKYLDSKNTNNSDNEDIDDKILFGISKIEKLISKLNTYDNAFSLLVNKYSLIISRFYYENIRHISKLNVYEEESDLGIKSHIDKYLSKELQIEMYNGIIHVNNTPIVPIISGYVGYFYDYDIFLLYPFKKILPMNKTWYLIKHIGPWEINDNNLITYFGHENFFNYVCAGTTETCFYYHNYQQDIKYNNIIADSKNSYLVYDISNKNNLLKMTTKNKKTFDAVYLDIMRSISLIYCQSEILAMPLFINLLYNALIKINKHGFLLLRSRFIFKTKVFNQIMYLITTCFDSVRWLPTAQHTGGDFVLFSGYHESDDTIKYLKQIINDMSNKLSNMGLYNIYNQRDTSTCINKKLSSNKLNNLKSDANQNIIIYSIFGNDITYKYHKFLESVGNKTITNLEKRVKSMTKKYDKINTKKSFDAIPHINELIKYGKYFAISNDLEVNDFYLDASRLNEKKLNILDYFPKTNNMDKLLLEPSLFNVTNTLVETDLLSDLIKKNFPKINNIVINRGVTGNIAIRLAQLFDNILVFETNYLIFNKLGSNLKLYNHTNIKISNKALPDINDFAELGKLFNLKSELQSQNTLFFIDLTVNDLQFLKINKKNKDIDVLKKIKGNYIFKIKDNDRNIEIYTSLFPKIFTEQIGKFMYLASKL